MQNGIVPVQMFCEQRQTNEELGSNKTYRPETDIGTYHKVAKTQRG